MRLDYFLVKLSVFTLYFCLLAHYFAIISTYNCSVLKLNTFLGFSLHLVYNIIKIFYSIVCSSEKRSLFLMKCSSEPTFFIGGKNNHFNMITRVVFFSSIIKQEKKYIGCYIPHVWRIMNFFARPFHQS